MINVHFLRSIINWFDTGDLSLEPVDYSKTKHKVEWARCTPFILMHLACFGVFFVGWSLTAVLTALFLYAVRMTAE